MKNNASIRDKLLPLIDQLQLLYLKKRNAIENNASSAYIQVLDDTIKLIEKLIDEISGIKSVATQ